MQYKCVFNIITQRYGAALGMAGQLMFRLYAKLRAGEVFDWNQRQFST